MTKDDVITIVHDEDSWPDVDNALAASAALRAYVEIDSPQIDDRWPDVHQDIMHLFHQATSVLIQLPASELSTYFDELRGWTLVLYNLTKIIDEVG